MQSVVIIGGGAFACEAMRSAVWNGAASVTLLTREKNKWAYRSVHLHTSQPAIRVYREALNWIGPVHESSTKASSRQTLALSDVASTQKAMLFSQMGHPILSAVHG